MLRLTFRCSQVLYIINKLAKRMTLGDGWLITLKSLMVYHRLMREVDPSFLDELLKFQVGRRAQGASCACSIQFRFNSIQFSSIRMSKRRSSLAVSK